MTWYFGPNKTIKIEQSIFTKNNLFYQSNVMIPSHPFLRWLKLLLIFGFMTDSCNI